MGGQGQDRVGVVAPAAVPRTGVGVGVADGHDRPAAQRRGGVDHARQLQPPEPQPGAGAHDARTGSDDDGVARGQ